MSIKLNKVLISDPVDDAAIEILRNRNLQVDVRTGLPKDQLLGIISVSVLNRLLHTNHLFGYI